MDSFKFYGSKILAYALFISIVSSAFATLAHADPSAYYKSTTTTGGY